MCQIRPTAVLQRRQPRIDRVRSRPDKITTNSVDNPRRPDAVANQIRSETRHRPANVRRAINAGIPGNNRIPGLGDS